MLNFSSLMTALKEIIMSKEINKEQQNRVIDSLCMFSKLIGWGIFIFLSLWGISLVIH